MALPIINFAATPAEQLTDILNGFSSMQADFSHQGSSGKMALQKPGKFRWEVQSPDKQLIIADGKNIWIYDVDLEQVIVRKIDSRHSNNPAMLLSGSVRQLANDFLISKINKPGGDWFALKPKGKNTMFQEVQLEFVENKLISMLVIDNLGQKNLFAFKNVKINRKLSRSLFKFVPPKGVDVIRE